MSLDPQKMMKMAAQMQADMARAQEALAEAIASALALRLEPRFVATSAQAAQTPTDGDGTISEVELLDQLRRRLDATEEAG